MVSRRIRIVGRGLTRSGDGSTATGANPSHVYARAGNFTVTLTTIDGGSNPPALSNTKAVTLTVQPGTVQNAPSLPLSTSALEVILAAAGLTVISAVYVLVRRRTRIK